ncbi:lysylphosphatidylglycerol synthase domain-containing protein [Sphingobacterium oryzagri]|uniref:Lysylphosphatidylglycerol synthase domain-containing protein n=1 Tax=Sphingobacterium oryzagri TaxID=3025669 RepID=A0ABY7WLD4_9SPHI|nr:lysylphosphatidylglycerol synthase domain-containing protein [Sphingobacterium sp. KACC 22765]WDF69369.1 lysylphosphatidylglycerol synthase domain-containing protein [Sphingobacterium sp. KACC 22765]
MTKQQKKYLNLVIKLAIVGLASWFIFSKVNNQKSLREFQHLLAGVPELQVRLTIAVVVLMMLMNWAIEVIKWKFLSRRIEKISWWKAIKSVFCGLTWAIFTPNRIGEYGGRVLLLKAENRASGAVAMGVGLFAQLVLTSVFGALSIAWFVSTYLPTPSAVKFGVSLIGSIYAIAFLVLYFNVHWIDAIVGRFRFLAKIKPFFSVLEDFTLRELWYVLLLSLARFVIFTSQYILLMLVFLPNMPFLAMVLMIFILFFIQSAVPSLDIFDFSVRSFVASNLYSYITTQEIAVMAIVSCIWFVNLILPAIVGSVFVLNVNYVNSNKS